MTCSRPSSPTSTQRGWRTPTPAPGWDVATQVSHLAWTDEVAVLAATDKHGWDAVVLLAMADPAGFVDAEAIAGAEVEPAELLARWRAARRSLASTLAAYGAGKMPWFGPPMSATSMATARLMETWAHSLDVHEALGAEPEATARLRHIAHLAVRTRDFAFITNSLTPPTEQFRIDLVAPDDDVWTFGPEDAAQTVTGSALDLCLLATQRTHRAATDLNRLRPRRRPLARHRAVLRRPARRRTDRHMSAPIRVGNCSGFYGDRLSAMREMLEGGELDVLTGDYLAELTMLILGKDTMKDPALGYARTHVRQLEDCMGLALERGVRIVSNAGGLNPAGLAEKLREVAARARAGAEDRLRRR